jgi:hypothetical protein
MSRKIDPKATIIQKIESAASEWGVTIDCGDAGIARMQPLAEKLGIEIAGPDVLLAVYDRSGQYTSGKVYVPDAYLEDKVQGKVALVLGMGPKCCGQDFDNWFGGRPPQIGEWWVTSIRDGLTFLVDKVVVKLVEYKYLRMRTLFPDLVQ